MTLRSLKQIRADGHAIIFCHPHPFPANQDGSIREGAEPYYQEIEAGRTLTQAISETGLVLRKPDYAAILVRMNGRTIQPEEYDTIILRSGDRIVARAMPKDPITIGTILTSIGAGLVKFGAGFAVGVVGGATGAGIGTGGFALGSAIGLGVGVGSFVGTLAVYVGGAFLLQLATRALVGSPDSGGTGGGATKRTSPTASGTGNQLLPDHPVFITCGDVRVMPPHIAVPFQPGVIGGDDQDPSLRELLGVAGDCEISEITLGKTPIELLEIKSTIFRDAHTIDFPTAEVKRPGITIRDIYYDSKEYSEQNKNRFEIVSTDSEVDKITMTWFLPAGLNRTNQAGAQKQWQLSFDMEYRIAGSGGWTGFFAIDGSGNGADTKIAPFVKANQVRGDNRYHLTGKTAEPFFFYIERKVARNRYEVRFRLRREEFYLKADGTDQRGDRIIKAHWPRDRWDGDPLQKADTDTPALATDPQLVQFASFRDEPAIQDFGPGLSGLDLELLDQTTKSDESGRLGFRCKRQIPNMQDGSGSGIWRTTKTTTSNPIAIILDLLTGALAGDTAVPDAQIDFASFYAAYLYCNELVPTTNGATEVRHRCDAVLDRSGIGRLEQVQDIMRNFRMKLIRMDGKYHIVVDKKRDAPIDLFSEAEILEFESDRSWTIVPDMLRVEFFNAEKMGDKDEIHVYNDSPAVAGVLEHGGYSSKTLEKGTALSPISVTVARDTDYAEITYATGWGSDFPEKGWVCIRFTGAGAPFTDPRLFLIDGVSSDLLTLRVIDKDGEITAGSRTGRFNTTAAERVEALSLPYSQRPSECFREARYFLAQRNRPEIYTIHVGTMDWLRVYRGAMVEVSASVPVFGKGSGRVIAIEGTATSCTAVQMDEEFDLAGITDPVIKFVTHNGSNIVVTRYDVNISNTNTKRAGPPVDNRWLSFDSPQNVSAIGMLIGGGNGSVGAFGEKTFETKELIVQDIQMGNDLSGTLRCIDHAPEIFDAILDYEPVPRFQSGITEPGTGDYARPAMPQIGASIDGVSTGMGMLNAGALDDPEVGVQTFTRTNGSFVSDGWTGSHKATFGGFTNSSGINNHVRAQVSASNPPTDAVLTVETTTGVSESGTGDERVYGVVGSKPTTLTVRRAATGVTKLDVVQGAGTATIMGPTSAAKFANFSASGFIELSGMPTEENNGWFRVTQILNGGDGILAQTSTMITRTGNGSERCHQSQFGRTDGGSFITDGIIVGDRIIPDSFEQDISAAVFTVRGVTANRLAVDDPFGLLLTETGDGDETVTVAKVPFAYEIDTSLSTGDLHMLVTIPIRPGTKGIVPTEEIEVRYRLRDRLTSRVVGGWITEGVVASSAVSATFGPIPADSDFDVALRAISRQKKTSSDWFALTGNGPADRPEAPTMIQVNSDSVASAEGNVFALRVEWA